MTRPLRWPSRPSGVTARAIVAGACRTLEEPADPRRVAIAAGQGAWGPGSRGQDERRILERAPARERREEHPVALRAVRGQRDHRQLPPPVRAQERPAQRAAVHRLGRLQVDGGGGIRAAVRGSARAAGALRSRGGRRAGGAGAERVPRTPTTRTTARRCGSPRCTAATSLYCLGHLLQAAIAYYRATGNRRLLDGAIEVRRLRRGELRSRTRSRRSPATRRSSWRSSSCIGSRASRSTSTWPGTSCAATASG